MGGSRSAACAPRPIAPSLQRTLLGHTDTVRALSLSRDGAVLYSGSWDGSVRAWRAADGAGLYTLPAGGGAVLSLVQSEDGELLFAGTETGDVRCWKGRVTRTLKGHTGPVRALAASRVAPGDAAEADPLLYSAGDDGTIRAWRAADGTCVSVLRPRGGGGASGSGRPPPTVWCLALSRDGETLYAGADDGGIGVWQPRQRAAAGTLAGHVGAVRALALARDDAALFSAGEDRVIRRWAPDTGDCTAILKGHTFTVLALALSRDGATLYSGSWDHTLRVVRALRVLTLRVHCAASALQRCARFLCAFLRCRIVPHLTCALPCMCVRPLQWRTSDGECLHCVGGPSGAAASFASASVQGNSSRPGTPLGGGGGTGDALWSLALSPDGTELHSASSDCTVRGWRVAAPPWAQCAPRAPTCSLRGGYTALLAALLGGGTGGWLAGSAIEAPPTPPPTPGAAAAAQVLARGGRTKHA
jgi:WD40 repeat protein